MDVSEESIVDTICDENPLQIPSDLEDTAAYVRHNARLVEEWLEEISKVDCSKLTKLVHLHFRKSSLVQN